LLILLKAGSLVCHEDAVYEHLGRFHISYYGLVAPSFTCTRSA
jgi:hypothetical protein